MPDPTPLSATPVILEAEGAALHERPLTSLLQFAVWPGCERDLARHLGLDVMPAPGRSMNMDAGTLLDGGPGRWLLVDSDKSDLPPQTGTRTDLGHARVRLRLSGARAATILAKGTAVDLRDAAFPVGAVAWTQIHHIGLAIHRTGPALFDLYPYRGFAIALSDWIGEAMRPDNLPV